MRAKKVNEAYGISGARLDTHEIRPYERVWAGSKGILGNEGVFIPWEYIMNMMKKYNIN
ncbi:MAG TPA: hypothetical protein VMZ29_05290 [Candidatus Bathyarchaeia archaeon]|nr:hypothetical protein [Candidatus Bathyarchaeia archaeon]